MAGGIGWSKDRIGKLRRSRSRASIDGLRGIYLSDLSDDSIADTTG
jgi:hypothetical protein